MVVDGGRLFEGRLGVTVRSQGGEERLVRQGRVRRGGRRRRKLVRRCVGRVLVAVRIQGSALSGGRRGSG